MTQVSEIQLAVLFFPLLGFLTSAAWPDHRNSLVGIRKQRRAPGRFQGFPAEPFNFNKVRKRISCFLLREPEVKVPLGDGTIWREIIGETVDAKIFPEFIWENDWISCSIKFYFLLPQWAQLPFLHTKGRTRLFPQHDLVLKKIMCVFNDDTQIISLIPFEFCHEFDEWCLSI